ncbi:MAG: glycoside hydrolase family 95 protein, partial [Clostridia bacterium]|nr:glycoside hydrolase family 95 protein [Clostridia bacterium]
MMKRYNGEQILCYDTPAESWNAALPLGNGKIGAMVYGGIQKEILAMNYDELWSGHPNDNPGDNVRPYMEEAKKALLAGNKPLAHQIITEHAKRGEASDYMPFGNVELMFHHGSASNYYRDLDLRTAISRVTYEADGGKYEREYLISYPDNAMAVSLKAKGALLNFDVTMTSPMMHKTKTENGVLLLDGVCFTYARPAEHPNSGGKNYSDTPIKDGISYRGAVKVLSDGNISLQADCLTVSNATYATLY